MSPAIYSLFVVACLQWSTAWAGPKLAVPANRIPVTLFGQPCMLEGPLAAAELKAVHAISPEEIATPFSSERTADETRKATEKLESAKGLPPSLDRYRERLARRLKAELAFIEGLQEARKKKSSEPLLKATREYVQKGKLKEFEASAKSLLSAADASTRWQQQTQLFDFYSEAIDAKPEDEFHRAIRTMAVQYTCSFEEADEGEE